MSKASILPAVFFFLAHKSNDLLCNNFDFTPISYHQIHWIEEETDSAVTVIWVASRVPAHRLRLLNSFDVNQDASQATSLHTLSMSGSKLYLSVAQFLHSLEFAVSQNFQPMCAWALCQALCLELGYSSKHTLLDVSRNVYLGHGRTHSSTPPCEVNS